MWFEYFTEPIFRYVGRIFKNPMAWVPYIFIKKWTLAIYTTSIIVVYLIFTNKVVQEKLVVFSNIMNYELGEAKAIAQHCTSHLANGQWSQLWQCLGDHPKYEPTEHDQQLEKGNQQEIKNDQQQVQKLKERKNYRNTTHVELVITSQELHQKAQILKQEWPKLEKEYGQYYAHESNTSILSTNSKELQKRKQHWQKIRERLLQQQSLLDQEIMACIRRINNVKSYISSNPDINTDAEFIKRLAEQDKVLKADLKNGLSCECDELTRQEQELLDQERNNAEKNIDNANKNERIQHIFKNNKLDSNEQKEMESQLSRLLLQQTELEQENAMLRERRKELSKQKAELKTRIEQFNEIS
ncbi:hypothetical protein OCHUTO_0821 [Orientia chuto str. Dubai]|uniref:Uncharacterized protein n=1 Tax=Orientia chuto str. Dubai TaxID=1359168 RepID=A0A0F3MIB9_9RICK|nr:DUF2670 domain-containing protein [Candidatus Orientia mediorientalis]KJV55513.1 hypothetical protein OCHUTO_0821 [Orientia chuto str. Dubai]